MIKAALAGESLKERLLASAKDRIYKFLLADGAVRGAILHGTRMVNEMRANHKLGILETLVLGRAYLGAGLMSANLKGTDAISIKIECSGPIKGLTVESNAFGEVRGFLKTAPIPIDKPMEDFPMKVAFKVLLIFVCVAALLGAMLMVGGALVAAGLGPVARNVSQAVAANPPVAVVAPPSAFVSPPAVSS